VRLAVYKRKDASIMDHKTLGDMFQEITAEFSQMESTTLDELESRTLDAIYRLGKALMQLKIEEWDTELHRESCPECGCRLENRHRHTQVGSRHTL
jgi:hypothetical protein